MASQSQKPSGLSGVVMKVLLRKRIICGFLLSCCLAVIVWLTFEQGRTKSDSEARWRYAKILPELDEKTMHDVNGVIITHGDGEEAMGKMRYSRNQTEVRSNRTAGRKGSGSKDERERGGTRNGDKRSGSRRETGQDLGMSKAEADRWIKEKVAQEYCNPPDRRITGEEGVFKPGYKLKAAYVVARHGDRTPMSEFTNIPNSTWKNPRWSCDLGKASNTMLKSNLLREFVQMMEAELKSRAGDMKGVLKSFKVLPIGKGVGTCQKSQLTPTGWLQLMRLGKFFRGVYGRTLVSRAEQLVNVSIFKSTINTRTQQSAFSFMFGFLKTVALKDTMKIRTVANVNFCPLEMCACPALERMVKEKEAQHSKIMRGNTGFVKAMKSVTQTLYGASETSHLPGINAVAEILATLVCHDMPYPCGSKGCVSALQHAAYTRYIDDTLVAQSHLDGGTYEKLGRMFIQPFLSEMTKNFFKISRGKSMQLFVFNSGHDVTLRPVVDALRLSGPGWPSYASRVVFELWEQLSSKQHFLRVVAFGKDQTNKVQFCKDKLGEDGLCPFSALLSFVDTDNMESFYSSSYQEACARMD